MPFYILHPLLPEPLELPTINTYVEPTSNLLTAIKNSEEPTQSGLYGRSVSELSYEQRAKLQENIRLTGCSLDDLDPTCA